ncbi:MAG: hypothetical protein C6H99_05825 [Epsilonproteobacteria bacterium]|nr:hypothetical protein [Campylobacterota bacterium]NPA64855.1 hypothetical protein [Campylobacterota bacterium]
MIEKDSSLLQNLQPAGAGLPPHKRLFARYIMFPLLNSFISWEIAWNIYDKESQKIVDLAKSLDKKQLFQRVLVPPLFGLEDNSRYYSVAMVLKHLLIVGEALVDRIPPLSQGEKLQDNITIEAVKPYTHIEEDIVERFERFSQKYRDRLKANIGDIHIKNTLEHPWFGPMNPKEWAILAMIHHIVHRRQIEAIVKKLQR